LILHKNISSFIHHALTYFCPVKSPYVLSFSSSYSNIKIRSEKLVRVEHILSINHFENAFKYA